MKQRIPSDYRNDVPRYNHNISAGEFHTVHCGLAIPTKFRHLNIGDRVRGSIETLVQTEPFVGPLMQGFDIVTIATFTPDSVIHGWQNNGQQFTPEQLLSFDYWQFFAMSPMSLTLDYDDNRPLGIAGLGFYDYDGDRTLSAADIASAWPYSTLGGAFYNHSGTVAPAFLSSVGRGGLWDCLGVPAGASPHPIYDPNNRPDLSMYPEYSWNVMPVVAYALSCCYYLRNIQESNMYFTLGPEHTASRYFWQFDPNGLFSEIEYMHFASRQGNVENMNFSYDYITSPTDFYGWQLDSNQIGNNLATICTAGLASYGGLFSVPYGPDLFNNIIKFGESPTAAIPVINVSGGGSVAVPDLRAGNKEQNMLDRLYASGGRWDDVRSALFGKKRDKANNKPLFLGAWKSNIDPTNTVSTSAGTGTEGIVDLAQMAARIDSYSNYGDQEYLDFFADESGVIMFISAIVPKPAYCQGLNPDLVVKSWADDFNPEMVGEGFQSVPRHRYTMLPSTGWFDTMTFGGENPNLMSVGEEVAWSWLKTDFSRLHGEFSTIGNSQYWTIHRAFTPINVEDRTFGSDSITTYVDPLKFQYLFTTQSILDANFKLYANIDLTVTNAVADNYMPFFGK